MLRGLVYIAVILGIFVLAAVLTSAELRGLHCPRGQHPQWIYWLKRYECRP